MSTSEVDSTHEDPEDLGKRRRIARACEQCRKKKIRCDGAKPCNNCIAYKTECIFTEATAKKRASPRGAKYIASLEDRLEKMERLLQSNLQSNFPTDGRKHAEQDESRLMQAVYDSSMSDTQSLREKTGSELELANSEAEALAEKMGYLFSQDNGEPEYVGASNSATLIVASQKQIREILGDASFAQFCATIQRRIETYQLQDYAAYMTSVTKLRPKPVRPEIPDKSISDNFVRLYFDYIYPLYPFLNKRDFMSRHEQMYDQTIDLGPSFHAVYLMVLSFGCHVADGIMPGQVECTGGRLYAQAHNLVIYIVEKNSLQAVHALMLLAQYLEMSGRAQLLWTLLGSIVRMAQSLGLHRRLHVLRNLATVEPSTYDTNNLLEIRRRTFWVLYIMDNNLVVATGKPASIQDFDCDQELPTIAPDELDHFGGVKFEDGTPFSYFIAQIRLVQISQRAQRELYSVAALSLDPDALLSRTQRLDAKLLAWAKNLPMAFQPETLDVSRTWDSPHASSSPCAHKFDAQLLVAFLHICYFSLMTTVHRRTTLMAPAFEISRQPTPQSPTLGSRIDASLSIAIHASRSSLGVISRALPRMQAAGIRLRITYPVAAVLNIFHCILRSSTSPTVFEDIQKIKALAQAVEICDLEHDHEMSILKDFVLEIIRVSERAMAQAGTQGMKREWQDSDDHLAQKYDSQTTVACDVPTTEPSVDNLAYDDVPSMLNMPWTGNNGFYGPELFSGSGYLLGNFPVLQDGMLGLDPYYNPDDSMVANLPNGGLYHQSSTLPYSYDQVYDQTTWPAGT